MLAIERTQPTSAGTVPAFICGVQA
eukprot:COSAG04_NODE_30456_length_262_cov_1.263804_2_plen_24_part_01